MDYYSGVQHNIQVKFQDTLLGIRSEALALDFTSVSLQGIHSGSGHVRGTDLRGNG